MLRKETREHPEFIALWETCKAMRGDIAPLLILSDWLEEHEEIQDCDSVRRVANYSYGGLVKYGYDLLDLLFGTHYLIKHGTRRQLGLFNFRPPMQFPMFRDTTRDRDQLS